MSAAENMERWKTSKQAEDAFEWHKWVKEIPELSFRPNWRVKVIPPFAAAVIRFVVTIGKARVSVYLDCYDQLGWFGAPHWEIYPDADDNNTRFAMHDTVELINEIDRSLRAQIIALEKEGA